MQINVVGILYDPTGNVLPNHDIRITSKESTLNSVETTDSNGNYSFILNEGWHYVEVLFKGKYLIVGDLLVDDSIPSPITLNDLIEYSTPVEPEDIYELPTEYQSLQDRLENSALTQYREQRSQLVNPLTHKVSLIKAYESNDGNERSMSESGDLTSCDAMVQTQNQVYTDSEGNTYSVTSTKQATKHVVKLDSVLMTDEYDEEHSIELGNHTESTTKLITSTGSVSTMSLAHGSISKLKVETINDTGISSNTNTTSTLGTLIENQSVLNSQLNLAKSFGEAYEDIFTYDGSSTSKKYSSTIEDKEVSITFTNTGSDTQGSVIADIFTIGREANRTFEVDSINSRVTVRGTLRITDLEDEDGNPIDIPEDGNTIFQVFQYGETVSGPWEDTLESYHKWKRENTSVNGYIDPTGWSIPYKFVGEDGVGNDGSTIYVEYNYSPDGATNWTELMKAGDAFRRERRVVDGVAEDWSDPVRIKGTDGDEIEIRSQYSVDGVSNWHNTFVDGDIYERRARFVNGEIDSAWSDPFQIIGSNGDDGIPGLNGSGWYSIVGNSGTWPGDTQATADFINTFGRSPQLDDHLFYVNQDPNPTQTEGKRCITPVGGSPIEWSTPRAYFDGDVIVKGTLSADRLIAQSVTGNEIDSQTTIRAGSGSTTAGINGYDLPTLPDWMGGGSNPYAGYRFWAGASTPEFANFKVSDTGIAEMIGAKFSTSASNERVEIQDDGTYLIWAGNGIKNDVNGLFWIKSNGTGFIKGDFFQGEIIATVSASNSGIFNPLEATSQSYESVGKAVSVNLSSRVSMYIEGMVDDTYYITTRVKRDTTTVLSISSPLNSFFETPEPGVWPNGRTIFTGGNTDLYIDNDNTASSDRTYSISSEITGPSSFIMTTHTASLYAQEDKLA